MTEETAVSLSEDLSEDNIQRMLYHINQLDDIRMNQDFRLVSLFGDKSGSVFLDKFSNCQPRMLQCLVDLEEVAVQLDSKNKGARISSDIRQAALKGPLALSKSARAGFIGLNAFFLGMDVFFICKDSISLSKGSETVVSQFIRARSTLWRSEIDAWEKIHDSLSKGQSTAEKNRIILETPFYPQPEVEKEDMEIPPEEWDKNTNRRKKKMKNTKCVIQ